MDRAGEYIDYVAVHMMGQSPIGRDTVLRGLADQRVALNPRRSYFDLIDLGLNLAFVVQLLGWGALGLYLLWRDGMLDEDRRRAALALAGRSGGVALTVL